jgi:hypothetical protein
MKGVRTGLGIVFGAALGLLFGKMFFDDWWIGPMIGVPAGLIIGAIAELMNPAGGLRPRPPSNYATGRDNRHET